MGVPRARSGRRIGGNMMVSAPRHKNLHFCWVGSTNWFEVPCDGMKIV